MDMKKEMMKIKEDINFLEYPNWLVSEKKALKTYKIEKPNGTYVISTTEDIDRLPDRTDKIILYYLVSYLMKDDFRNRVVETSRYRIAKDVLGSFKYERIMLGLKRWHSVSINFHGVFYEGDGYSTRYFNVIDNVILKENKLKIYFNIDFLEQLRNTNYFKLIDFDEYKRLRRPVSARLYEILVKTFKDRDTWQIGIIKLAEKLTLEKRYPSQILEKLIPAVNEINKRTGLKIHFDYNKETHVCTFTKVKQSDSPRSQDKTQQVSLPFEDDRFVALTELLPKEHEGKKTILDALNRTYQKHGFDYVARNIRYTNRYCKGNYRAYLTKALKEDWGVALEEDDKRKEKVRKEQERKHHEEQEDIKNRTELNRRAREEIEKLSSEEIEALREEALSQLDSTTRKNAEKLNFIETLIRSGMEEIIRDRLRDEDKDR
jgi:hypothetical protein